MRYKIVGLSKDMRSVFIFKKKEDGTKVFTQKPIKKGIEFTIAKDEMSFHVERLAAWKIIKLTPFIEIAPEPEASKKEDKKKLNIKKGTPKKRGRPARKKYENIVEEEKEDIPTSTEE